MTNKNKSEIIINLNREKERTEIDFNLVAFGLIYWIYKLSTKIEAENDDDVEVPATEQR
jgi:hypothetical protein